MRGGPGNSLLANFKKIILDNELRLTQAAVMKRGWLQNLIPSKGVAMMSLLLAMCGRMFADYDLTLIYNPKNTVNVTLSNVRPSMITLSMTTNLASGKWTAVGTVITSGTNVFWTDIPATNACEFFHASWFYPN